MTQEEKTLMSAENGTAAPSAALVAADAAGMERLKRQPIIDTIDRQTLALIKAQVAPGCNDAEVGHFLELCAHYELDPFAREAWCAKNRSGTQLLIMVGRDGLRKIAQRNGLHVDGDVVRAKDDFTICRTPDGNRTVAHSYGNPAARGEIVGAWAECRMGGPKGKPMGYFYAPLDEYRPRNASEHSPWSKQVGVMILAAAERQAIRQATPLSGLLAEGEDEVIRDGHDPVGGGDPAGIELAPAVEAVIARAGDVGHAGLADRGMVELAVGGQPDDVIAAWVARSHAELDTVPAIQDAEVVTGEPVARAVEDMENEANALADAADCAEADGDVAHAEELRDQAVTLMDEVRVARGQGQLL